MRELYKILGKVGISLGGNYNPKIQYKEKTIVYDEINNKSYVSKKEVPAGIELTNKEYWQLVIKDNVENIKIYNELGNSTTDAISQDITTKELKKRITKNEIIANGRFTQLSDIRPIVDGVVEDGFIQKNSIFLSSKNPTFGEGVFWIKSKQRFAYKHKNQYYDNWDGVINRKKSNYLTEDSLPKQNIYIYNNKYYFVTYEANIELEGYNETKSFNEFETFEQTYIKRLD